MTRVTSTEARTQNVHPLNVAESSAADVNRIVAATQPATEQLAAVEPARRAALLRSIAGRLGESAGELVAVADHETALGGERLGGELARCQQQLELFASVLEDGAYLEATIDHATDVQPEIRRMLVPVGIAAVFGTSNFPFAFSVAGGDTASALAAGCAVVAKGHPSHPETSALSATVFANGADAAGFDRAVVSVVFGVEAGQWLVAHPGVAAVGFTGSASAAAALEAAISTRSRSIPFYGELGSVNPLIVTPRAAAERAEEVGRGLAASVTLGMGQFCTKPGLVFVPAGDADELLAAFDAELNDAPTHAMLNDGIRQRFEARLDELASLPINGTWISAPAPAPPAVSPRAVVVTTAELTRTPALREECFGPMTVIARYDSVDEVIEARATVEPALTATIHAGSGDDRDAARLLPVAAKSAGRVVWNGFPTGVRVSWGTHHGGMPPSTTNALHSSVGATAIRRWLRPVAYQAVPDAQLPAALREANPMDIPRRVDGVPETQPQRTG